MNGIFIPQEEPGRKFITREFADTISGKRPDAYLRRHDPVQELFAQRVEKGAESSAWQLFANRFIHFFRELSLFQLPRAGRGLDECCALAFEAAFDLAMNDSSWCEQFVVEGEWTAADFDLMYALGPRWKDHEPSHAGLCEAITDMHAPRRERGEIPADERFVIYAVERWFGAGMAVFCRPDVDERIALLKGVSEELSAVRWNDRRLHTRIIRGAPLLSPTLSKADLLAHPILRMAKLRHPGHPAEAPILPEFLNSQCIKAGWESEEDVFTSDLGLACWVRDARTWAEDFRRARSSELKAVFREAGRSALEGERAFIARVVGPHPERIDDIAITEGLIGWRREVRGTPFSRTRGEVLEAIVHCVEAALWIGFLSPR